MQTRSGTKTTSKPLFLKSKLMHLPSKRHLSKDTTPISILFFLKI